SLHQVLVDLVVCGLRLSGGQRLYSLSEPDFTGILIFVLVLCVYIDVALVHPCSTQANQENVGYFRLSASFGGFRLGWFVLQADCWAGGTRLISLVNSSVGVFLCMVCY
ncbi:hypothetical protein NPIL_674551, partial [Nephila pilipes]